MVWCGLQKNLGHQAGKRYGLPPCHLQDCRWFPGDLGVVNLRACKCGLNPKEGSALLHRPHDTAPKPRLRAVVQKRASITI